jgi:hypothetical protein
LPEPLPATRPEGWRRWFWALRSRKVQVALATVVASYLLETKVEVSEETLAAVLGVGISLILGIAHEDAGKIRGG